MTQKASPLACQFFHDWQFLSVLGRLLGDHLPIRPYILCLGPDTFPTCFPTSSFSVLTTATLQLRPAHRELLAYCPLCFLLTQPPPC